MEKSKHAFVYAYIVLMYLLDNLFVIVNIILVSKQSDYIKYKIIKSYRALEWVL